MAFSGFPREGLQFFQELARKQDRAWFAEHKAEYEEQWVAPMRALLEELAPLLTKKVGLKLEAPKLFRIHRDVRFSANKEPYKTHCAGLIALRGDQQGPDGIAALYVQLGLEGFAGAGQYGMDSPTLARFRAAVAHPKSGAELEKIVKALEKKGFTLEAIGSLKKVPRGFDSEHPRARLLKLQGLVFGFPAPPSEALVHTPRFKAWLLAQASAAAPGVKWLARHLR